MKLDGLNIGICVTGSFCTLNDNLEFIEDLKKQGANITAIFSNTVCTSTNKFSDAKERYKIFENITEKKILDTIEKAEPIGPNKYFDVLTIIPCTGNTLAKLANGITDTPVTMAAKAHMRNNLPVVIAISSNDALGLNAKNLGILLNSKNIYFVPFYQDSPITKEKSLIFKGEFVADTILLSTKGKQLQPLILGSTN